MRCKLRQCHLEDLEDLLELEHTSWPADVQATQAQLRDRLKTFAEGFFGVWDREDLLGMASSQVIQFTDMSDLKPWSELTANGWISRTHCPEGNCLHFVSVCVHPDFRHRGIGTTLNRARLDLAVRLQLRYALTDTRLPGLAGYLGKCDGATPQGYIEAIVRDEIREPAVHMYLRLGFRPVGLIADCMESDEESADYGLALLKDLQERDGV